MYGMKKYRLVLPITLFPHSLFLRWLADQCDIHGTILRGMKERPIAKGICLAIGQSARSRKCNQFVGLMERKLTLDILIFLVAIIIKGIVSTCAYSGIDRMSTDWELISVLYALPSTHPLLSAQSSTYHKQQRIASGLSGFGRRPLGRFPYNTHGSLY